MIYGVNPVCEYVTCHYCRRELPADLFIKRTKWSTGADRKPYQIRDNACRDCRNARMQRVRVNKAKGCSRCDSDGYQPFPFVEWGALLSRTGNTCACCGVVGQMTIDHIVPVTAGGDNSISNLQPLCKPCNSAKGCRTVERKKKARGD
jgi:5-methylcytosine-specific restriction endonuclease McrA